MLFFISLRYPQCTVHYFLHVPRPFCIPADRVNLQIKALATIDLDSSAIIGRSQILHRAINSGLELGPGSPQPATVLGVVVNRYMVECHELEV